MRLKRLILHGFKSFADRTEFTFDAPITGIVGPNGCGKSNVVDGFKWVLGEQSAKSLRGDAMLDVIFNGAASRKPAGMAEVVLVFENPVRTDGTRLLAIDADEVSVGRRLYRDGTSEYTLNNATSRLKDVRELFFDTGVGVDAYSVIEQGRVSAMLESNPAERRLIFEEAAGISKFKQRKKEAVRKLERVDQNLLRVKDVVDEVEKRLRGVKIQAGRARVYQEHAGRLGELRLSYAVHEYHTHFSRQRELMAALDDARFRLDDAAGDLAKAQNEYAEAKRLAESAAANRQELEYDVVQSRATLQSAKQKQEYARQQLAQIAEQAQQFEDDRAVAQTRLAQATESLEVESENLQRLTAELEAGRVGVEERQAAFKTAQLELNRVAAEIEAAKRAILDNMRRLSSLANRLGAIEIEQRNITTQQTRISDRRQVVVADLETLVGQRGELDARMAGVLETIAARQAELEARKNDAAALGRQIAETSEQLSAAKEHRSGLVSRQRLLKDLEAKREGVSEGVKSVLRQREQKFPFIRGLVVDVLGVDVEHAKVIEAALDGRDQWLVADDSLHVLGAAERLADLEGRVNVLCTDRLDPALDAADFDWNATGHRVRLAVDLVRFEQPDARLARHLLARTVVVDTLAIAFDLHRAAPGWRFVTTDAQVLEADGTLRAGPLTAAMSLISRRSELVALQQQIEEVDRRIVELSARLSEGSQQAKALEEETTRLRNAAYAANTQRVETQSLITQNTDKQNMLRREQPLLEKELANFAGQQERFVAEQQKLQSDRAALETEQARQQSIAEESAAKQVALGEQSKSLSEQLTQLRVSLGQIQEKQIASQSAVRRHQSQQAETTQQLQRMAASAEGLMARQKAVRIEMKTAAQSEMALEAKLDVLAEKIAEVAAVLQQHTAAAAEQQARVDRIRATHAETEQQVHKLEIASGEVAVRLEGVISRAAEEMQVELPAHYAKITESAAYEPGEVDWPAVAAEIGELREKIRRLGNVNLESIGEQDELEKRSQFMAAQLADLAAGKQQLEELIEQINVESAVRFEQTFNTVREHFQGMFRKLFGGGKADVFLETELAQPALPTLDANGVEIPAAPAKKYDILDAGIEIIARPPGKQPATISQLSGGEKTMTCIALLMSIFKSKPSPFCILDEVDAALDEANNQRFNMIVQEFLEQSQFIVITHSKRTMTIANQLYGVTMQEQGVSKRVPVKFDQVGRDGRIAADAVAAAAV